MARLTEFFDSYRKKADFLKKLSHKRKAPDEIILLACCYLDQLGTCLFPEAGSVKHSFEKILIKHSGESDEFKLISVGNLASDIFRIADFANVMIEKPGRIQLWSEEDKTLIRFIDQSGVALSGKSVNRLLISIYENLKLRFRIHPYQTKNKVSYGYTDEIIDSIMSTPKLKKFVPDIEEEHVRNLLKEYMYSSILYHDYRCKAVHEIAGIYVDSNRFWRNERPYFVEYQAEFSKYNTFKLEFPSYFLIECFETCIDCTEKAIIGKGLLPSPIFRAICDFDEIDFLDIESMEDAKPIKLKLD